LQFADSVPPPPDHADLDPGTDLDMLDAFEAMVPNFAIAILTTRGMYPSHSVLYRHLCGIAI
jgi:hypothetical protein